MLASRRSNCNNKRAAVCSVCERRLCARYTRRRRHVNTLLARTRANIFPQKL